MSTDFFDGYKRVKPMDEQGEFVMSFIDHSRDDRDDMHPIWDETEQNFLVRPYLERGGKSTANPLDQRSLQGGGATTAQLKDPETHQQIMTIASKVVLPLFPRDGFVAAKGVGFEDTFRGSLVSNLLQYSARLPTQFSTFLQWIMSAGIYGTGIIMDFWHYQEEMRTFRTVRVDEAGVEQSEFQEFMAPVYDDPRSTLVDVRDFFPDPAATQCEGMTGAAYRFKMTASEAMRKVAAGQFRKEATREAIKGAAESDADEQRDKPDDSVDSLTHHEVSHPDFNRVVGFSYYGEAPFRTEPGEGPSDGIRRKLITVLNGQTVQSDSWSRRIPFFDVRLTPRLNSFWGISPAEIISRDQDFADMMKMMLADAVVRSTHPPLIYNKYGDVDHARLLRFRPDVPVGADLRQVGQPVYQLPYNPPVQAAFGMYAGVKEQMRESTGALGAVQGLGLGSKRFSATEAAETFAQAADRPELFARVVEQEYLPPWGKYRLGLYQEFLDTEGVRRRVGETGAQANLADILPQFDIEFVGTRHEASRTQMIQAFREIVQASANPVVAQLMPWIPLLRDWFNKLGAHEIAAMVGNPQMVQLNVMLNQQALNNTMGGNGNGEVPSGAPPGRSRRRALGLNSHEYAAKAL